MILILQVQRSSLVKRVMQIAWLWEDRQNEVSPSFMQPLLKHHGIFCVLKHCTVTLDRELPEEGKGGWGAGSEAHSSNIEGKVSFFFLKTNNSMRNLQLSEAIRESLREDHLHKIYKLKETE